MMLLESGLLFGQPCVQDGWTGGVGTQCSPPPKWPILCRVGR